MAVAKICGIETEYGIIVRNTDDSNPITASSVLVNSYVTSLANRSGQPGRAHRVGWDFDDESPANDARGNPVYLSFAPEIETHLVNAVLTNGSRFYVDHAHPELSTPECASARQVLLYDRAGEEILRRAMTASARHLTDGAEIVVYKNNSDGKGQSYGCHENYLLARSLPFGRIVSAATIHFVTRQIFTGAGKVGVEAPGVRADGAGFQITQRADFFEEEVGLETTLKRPIVNTRDEPHADSQKYRRLHVIVGDANMSEYATYLKVGSSALWFAALEDGGIDRELKLHRPVAALQEVSLDLSLGRPLLMADGSTMTALDAQWEILRMCTAHVEREGGESVGGDELAGEILSMWEETLEALATDPLRLADRVDWIAKHRLLDGYRERHGLEWSDPRLAAMDLQYHDLRSEKSLAAKVRLRTLVDQADVDEAVTEPPPDTRAYFRGRCLQRYADDIVAANWDSIVFDTGGASLQRVPMMEPTRGTRAHVGALIDDCDTSAELLERLGR